MPSVNVKFTMIYFKATNLESLKLCCHKEKIVLECDVQCKVPLDNQSEKQLKAFAPGDAFGIYSSNLLADVYQVLISVLVKDKGNEDSILLWDYFKVTKKQVYIKLGDKVLLHSFHNLPLTLTRYRAAFSNSPSSSYCLISFLESICVPSPKR